MDPEAAAIERATGVGADAPDEADIEQLLFRAREREFITSGEIFAAFPGFEPSTDDLAAIFVEPVAGNMGCVPPAAGFLEALRALKKRA